MALNCVMLNSSNKPVPLPQEKVFLTVPGVSISLAPTQLGAPTASSTNPKGKAAAAAPHVRGEVSVTNQRIVFVSDHASSLPSSPNTASTLDDIRTLTIPLTHHHDGRFVQPWFSANAHECNVTPIRGGGLDKLVPESTGGAEGTGSFALKISFSEGHGFEFHEALEEVKRRLHDAEGRMRATEPESLPVYSPPSPTSASLPAPEAGPSPPPTAPGASGTRRPPRRQNTMPADDDLEAAEVARRAEAAEAAERAALEGERSESDLHAERGAPPAYDG